MSKRLTHEIEYDAPLARVVAMLADPGYRDEVCIAQGGTPSEITLDGAGAGMTVVVDQVQPAEGIPAFAKKFVGDEINIVQAEDWTSPEKGNIHVTIPGKPGEMTGTALLTEDPDGTTETVNLTVKVHIPLVGAKIEGLIADLLLKALRAEHEVGVRYLAA